MAATVKQLLDCAVLEVRHNDVVSVLNRLSDDLRRVDLFDVGEALSQVAEVEGRKERDAVEDERQKIEDVIDEAVIFVTDVYPDMGDALRRHLRKTFKDD